MGWTIVGIILACIFFISTLVLSLVILRRKKPVWAYSTEKIIELGSDEPSELKLYFKNKPILDAYRTYLVFFNQGKETIRSADITDTIKFVFDKGQVLRNPDIVATSRKQIRLAAIMRADNAVEMDFSYLDYHDGAAIEVLHTSFDRIIVEGNIIGAKTIRYIGTFDPIRWKLTPSKIVGIIIVVLLPLLMFVPWYIGGGNTESIWGPLSIPLIFYTLAFLSLRRTFRHLRFPQWSRFKEG